MSKKAVYLLGVLLTIILGTILYCKLCNTCCVTEEAVPKPVVVAPKETTKNPFLLKDFNGSLDLNASDNLNFNVSGITILKPISKDVTDGVDSLKVYLDGDPLKIIGITGLYTSDEINNSAFPNLGLARANAVKNYFVSKGISSRQIDTFGALDNDMVPDQAGVLYGPEQYMVSTREVDDKSHFEALELIHAEISEHPLVMNFDTAKATIDLSGEQREKVAKISRYLDKVEGASITIVGHTDNTGNAEANLVLGQERADFAKSYFIRNHIPEGKIITVSKGQTEPIANNATEEGRANNRRITVIFK
ncbi:OmpA family protein [Formosa algae]|uniref:Outer membrane protein OmpA-like peptidoglycan-associated protein n=1 Tax=Formosa algae TaxID=225843 RepID=A0A9X0YGZ2_9FLAO|nr:OmpA family protein [Formosa algae]MBP1838485.1 outer membrane protein OmpA-like peptidoglycan-associated protein [Formosa algae]MDQ0334620.1 outer membrane protein OmpA-like peptidoglycan-associated protein [Formosa algae]OEI79152.1 hypothetical protein AST99_16025 [Formosa algae]